MSFVHRTVAAAIACSALLACKEAIVDPPGDLADLRLLHASAGLGVMDIEIDGVPVIRGVAFGASSPLVAVPAGSQRLVVKAAGAVLGSIQGELSSAHVNSVVVAGGVPQLSAVVVPDTGQVAPNRANLRMIVHASGNPASPTNLQALLTGSSLPADSTLRFGVDATQSRYSSLMYFDPGTFTFRYVPAGTNGPVLAEATFAVAAGQTKAIILSRAANGTYKAEVVVEP